MLEVLDLRLTMVSGSSPTHDIGAVCLCFTMRGNTARIISVRKVQRNVKSDVISKNPDRADEPLTDEEFERGRTALLARRRARRLDCHSISSPRARLFEGVGAD
ncbi:MAG: hypothetical protein R3C97_19410 [Geminicoccaceae bacterium]